MEKLQIYYCIDVNLWYVEECPVDSKPAQSYEIFFNSYTEAVKHFIKYREYYLSEQKTILLEQNQTTHAKEDMCYLETPTFFYKISKDGAWRRWTKS